MKNIVLRFGIYAALCELVSFFLCWLILTTLSIGISAQGNLGWAAILCPLVFVYFGIRYFREHVNSGSITFLQALKVGLLITIAPALFYAFIETIYVAYINPKFYENIFTLELDQYRKTLSPAQFTVKMTEMKKQLVLDNNPVYNFVVIAVFIACCGAVISLLSALLLKRRPPLF